MRRLEHFIRKKYAGSQDIDVELVTQDTKVYRWRSEGV
jgi:hypothetical protein